MAALCYFFILMSQEKHEFQAEVRQLLKLVVHSLYTHKEVFLRELLSNASDAVDKRRYAALTDPSLAPPESGPNGPYRIVLEAPPGGKTLSVSDNGIGMDRDELQKNLGTIARSGTQEFLERLKAVQGQNAPDLIGQFGVGFYSAFMAAEKVSVVSRKAGQEKAWRWESAGEGEFTLEEAERSEPGTTVELTLRKPEAGEPDFADAALLKRLVKRYSDFVPTPIELAGETLNSMTPLWTKPAKDITPEEHAGFYRRLARESEAPLESIRFSAEGASLRYDALLYVPAKAPLDWLLDPEKRGGIQLYSKRVFIMDDCRGLAPDYLRFLRGVVDCPDLPLNVSRETLQQDRSLGLIQERVTRKTLESLKALLENDRKKYEAFWGQFGRILKEGLYTDSAERDRLKELVLFETSRSEGLSTFKEYSARMPEGQKEVYYLCGDSRAALLQSPHLEALNEKGWEVVFFTDAVDEFVVGLLHDWDGKLLRSAREDLRLDEKHAAREEAEKAHPGLGEVLKSKLSGLAAEVRFSEKLTQSPSALVNEGAPSPAIEKAMRRAGHPVPEGRRILELNPSHPVVEKLAQAAKGDKDAQVVEEYAQLLYGLAALREGLPLPDGGKFSRLVADLMAR